MALVSDWTQIGTDLFYRQAELYTQEWGGGLNVADLVVRGAAYGGPIAITWPSNMHRTTASAGLSMIVIFSAAGVKMGSIKWGSGGIVELGWSQAEDLLCIQQDGAVSVYDMFSTYKHTFSMGQEAKDAGICSAQLFNSQHGTGVAVITNTNRVYVVANIDDPHPRKYADIPSGTVSCWAVLKEDRQLSVLISQENKGLCCTTAAQCVPIQCPLSSNNTGSVTFGSSPPAVGASPAAVWCSMAVCGSSKSVALLSKTGLLWLGTADLSTHYTTHDTKSSVTPRQIAWCGSGSVVLVWEVSLQLVTITGSTGSFYLDSPARLVQEVDCVRLIGDTKHHILYKVSNVSVQTLGIGSMSAGALLVEAHIGYQEQSPRAYDCLIMIQGREEEAVEQCLGAASQEFLSSNIKLLLKAAIFGRTFLPKCDPDAVRHMAFKLRLLTELRTKKVGMPLTWNQLERLTVGVVLERLVVRRLFPVALTIANSLPQSLELAEHPSSSQGMSEQAQCVARILAHWAHYKMVHTSNTSDEQLAQAIHSKLNYTAGISYTDIADTAARLNKPQLAVKLLRFECRAQQQVTALLRLGETGAALTRAQLTGDTDLILTVLLHVKRTVPLGDFLMLVSSSTLCRAVYARSCTSSARDTLRDLYVQEDNFLQQAYLRMEEAYAAQRTDMRLGLLQSTAECFRRGKDDLAVQLTTDQIRLTKCQVALEETHGKSYVDLSLSDTLTQLIRDNHTKDADKLRGDFKVPDKRYWYLRVCAHAQANHWQELEQFSKSKKTSPIGYEPFVDECLKQGNNVTEARKYVNKVKDEARVEYLRKCGLHDEADKLAQPMAPSSAFARVITAITSTVQ